MGVLAAFYLGAWTAQLACGVAMFSYHMERRGYFAIRCALSVAVLGFALVIPDLAADQFGFASILPPLLGAPFISALCGIAAAFAVVHLCFKTGVMSSIFVATAAYTIQNLSSGVMQLADMTFGGEVWWFNPITQIVRLIIITIIIYIAVWQLWARRVTSSGLNRVESPAMVVMIVMIIVFCVVLDRLGRTIQAEVGPYEATILVFAKTAACILMCLYEESLLRRTRLETDKAIVERLLVDERTSLRWPGPTSRLSTSDATTSSTR